MSPRRQVLGTWASEGNGPSRLRFDGADAGADVGRFVRTVVRHRLATTPEIPAPVLAERVGWSGSITSLRNNIRRLGRAPSSARTVGSKQNLPRRLPTDHPLLNVDTTNAGQTLPRFGLLSISPRTQQVCLEDR